MGSGIAVGVGSGVGVGAGSTVGVGTSRVTVAGVEAGVGADVGGEAAGVAATSGAAASPHARHRKPNATIRPAIREMLEGPLDWRLGASRRPLSCLRTRRFTQRASHRHSGNHGWVNANVSCGFIARRIGERVSRVDRLSRVRRLPWVCRPSKTPPPLQKRFDRTPRGEFARGTSFRGQRTNPVGAIATSIWAPASRMRSRGTGKFCRCRTPTARGRYPRAQ